MAKKKLNAFNDRNAKEITTEDVEGLLKMQKEAKDKANYEANKADYKAPKYNSLPTLDDTSRKVSTKAPSVSPEQPKTMNVGNKTFKVADNARKTSIDSGKKLATGKKDEQTEYYNKQIEKRNNLKRSESSLGNYGWEGSLKSIRNKQIAKTDRELASTYVNDKANEQEVNNALAKWSNPNYKMSEFERKQAKAITKDYFKGSDKKATYRAKNGLGADAKAKGLSAINFADDLANGNEERYNLMNQLAAKSNKASAVAMGGVDALGTNTLAKALNNAIGDEETAKTITQMEQNVQGLKNQSPLAYNAGYMGTKMGEYAMLNNALDSIPALSKTGQALNKLGGLPKDMLADLALDTAFEVGENAVNGESAGQIGIDTAKNIGANLVFNMLPELLGGALKSANPEMADDVVKNLSEALQKEEVKPDTSFVDFANELTNRDINVSPYMDNTQRATIDRLRAENPQLLGRLSDEDVLAFDRANTGADVLNQNYETLRNVMNNTDQPTRAIADNGGDIPSALDIMPNEATGNYKVIQDFRAQNPALAQNMSDRDIMNYLNTPKSMPSLEKPIANEVAEEVAKEVEPTMTAIDYDNAVRDLSERYSIANEVDDLIYDDLAKAITFDSDADRDAFEEVYNAFIEDSKNVMNGGSTREVAENMQKVYDDYKALDEVMRRGYVADSGSKKELQKIKKNFYNDTKGTVIRLTPELRHEMGLDGKTIAELNNELRLGKNGIRFSANNGTPIDMLFDELKQASGNAMRDAENSADQINALMEYVESLKNGEGAKMRVDGRDLVDADFWDSFEESAYAYGDELGKLGERPEGEGLPIREEVPDNITNIFDEEPAVRYMAEDTGIGRSTVDETDIPERVTDYGSIKTEERLNPEANSGYERPEIDNPNPEFGTSQLYSNTLQKTVDPEEFAKFYNATDYAYEKTNHKQLVENAAKICNENFDNEYKRLLNLESFDAQDVANAAFIRDYLSNNGYEKEASDFMRRIRPVMSTMPAQALEAHKLFARSTPEGALDEMLMEVTKKVDKAYGKGYTTAVDRLADKVADAISNGDTEGAKELLDKKLGDFALGDKAKIKYDKKTIKGKQEVLNLINNAPNTKSLAELAEEAKKMIKKAQDVSTFNFNDEQKVMGILKRMEGLDPKSREYKQLEAQAASYVQNFMPSSIGNQVKNVLYNNMLGNIRTALSRNFVGNAILNTTEAVQHPLRAGLDALVGKATGVRNYTMEKTGKQWADWAKGFGKGASDQWSDLKTGLKTTRSGEEGMLEALNNNTNAWKYSDVYDPTNKKWLKDGTISDKGKRFANRMSDIVSGVMGEGDRPFYEAAYAKAKTELNLLAARYGDDVIQRAGTTGNEATVGDLIEFWAHRRALEACLQQGSLSAEALGKIKEGIAKLSEDAVGVDLLSMATSAFTQVPGNIISVSMDYSIPGIFKNAFKTAKELHAGDFNQKRFVDQTTRNLAGLAMSGAGIAAAKNGLITGPKSEDVDKAKAESRAGELEYALNLPNGTQIDISDIPVWGGKLQEGATNAVLWDKVEKGELEPLDAIVKGIEANTEAMFGTAAMQGLNKLTGASNTYNTNKGLGENLVNTLGTSTTQFIPSLARQTAQTLDPYKRDLGEYGTVDYYKNYFLNSIPGLRQTMPIKLDNQAHPYLQNQGRSMGMKALENYILPYTISQPDKVYSNLDKVANDLYDRLGTDANPAYVPTIDKATARELLGDNYNSHTYYDMKKQYGETVDALGSKIINSKDFKSLSDADKVDVLKNTYATAKEITKRSYGKEATKNAAADYYENGDINSAVNSLIDKKILSNMSEQYTKKNGEGKSFSDLSKEENLKVLTDMVNNGYMTKEEAYDYLPDNKMVETLSQYGNQGYELYADLVQYGTSNEGKFTNEKVIPVLRGTNTDPKIAGEVLHAMNSGGNSKRADQVYNELGPEGLWDYYNYKEYANLDGKGNISKDELVAYLNSRDMDRDEKYFWFDMLKSGSNVKNPY